MGKPRQKVSGFYPKAQRLCWGRLWNIRHLLLSVGLYPLGSCLQNCFLELEGFFFSPSEILFRSPIRESKKENCCGWRESWSSRFPPVVPSFSQFSPFGFSFSAPLPCGTPVCPRPSLVAFSTLCQDPAPLLCLPRHLLKHVYCVSSNMHIFL